MEQIATTIEQSKELVRLGLDPKTADMFWKYSASLGNTDINGRIAVSYHDNLFVGKYDGAIPAWSLSALLEVMPKEETPYIMYLNEPPFDEEYRWQCGLFDYIGSPGSSPIEAAFQMVCWLLENGFIKKGGVS